ncbi:7-cyano-7-deazaguanine synthase [Paenibacillus macerans]|uniref:7-cyano-7-deazaguanine synthase n=1 Tax=Paenibacillus macerans TaxID=44252 RepID=UPI003D31906F
MLSGGPDSSTLAYWVKQQGYELHSLTFNFGEEEGDAEKQCSQFIADQVSSSHKFVDFISPMKDLYAFDDIPDPIHILRKVATPYEHVRGFGAGIALSIAASYAIELGASDLFYAVHKDDTVYRENNDDFFKLISKAISIECGKGFKIHTPFLGKSKAEVLRLGAELGVPLQKTWSCATNSEIQCGTCEPCKDRRNAFIINGIEDLTLYKDPSQFLLINMHNRS